MSNIERSHPEQRPPIVLMALDRERLFALLGDALTTVDMDTACFLREEIERADIAPDDVAPNSLVRTRLRREIRRSRRRAYSTSSTRYSG